METNVNYTLAGAFVITLVAAIVLSIIWLSAGFSLEQNKTYMVYMQESVTGLNIDSPVEFNGVNVGAVKDIQLNHFNPQIVEVLVNIKTSTPVTRGTTATLATRGVTGFTYVALKDTSQDLRSLVQRHGQPYPVITTSPSLFVRLDTALSQLSTDLRQVAESMQSVLDKENQLSIKDTLHNLKELTGNLAANSHKLDIILDNTAKASRQFVPLLQSSTTALHLLETQTLPSTYRILSNLDEMTRTLSTVARELKQNPAVLIRGTRPQPLGPGERK